MNKGFQRGNFSAGLARALAYGTSWRVVSGRGVWPGANGFALALGTRGWRVDGIQKGAVGFWEHEVEALSSFCVVMRTGTCNVGFMQRSRACPKVKLSLERATRPRPSVYGAGAAHTSQALCPVFAAS